MDNISTLAGQFKSFTELQDYCNSQYVIIQKLTEENKSLQDKIKHLEEVLSGTSVLIDKPIDNKIQVSTEQAIIEMQIEKMKTEAMARPLTLEETKRLDLLIKNLHLIKGQSTQIVETKLKGNWTEDQLIQMATQPESDE